MKSQHALTPIGVVLFGLALLATPACSQENRDQAGARAAPVAQPVPSATAANFQAASDKVAREANLAPVTISEQPDISVADHLSSHTFEERDAFVALANKLVAQADTDIAALKMGYNDMLAGKAQQDAMAGLDRAALGFKDKVGTLDAVRAETWDTVKSAVVSFWINLQTALAKARAEQV